MTIRTGVSGNIIYDGRPEGYVRLKPGPGKSRLEVAASQRTRLQRAMIELAARDGLDAVTVRRLTRLARVAPRAFYAQFSGTGDCMLATYGEIMAAAAKRLGAVRSADAAPHDQVDLALRGFLQPFLDDADLARFTLIEIYAGGPAALAVIAAEEQRIEGALRGCLNRRSRRVACDVITAIVAATFHWMRARIVGILSNEEASADSLVDWARDVIAGKDGLDVPILPRLTSSPAQRPWRAPAASSGECGEEDLIVAAVLRIAKPNGFAGLTPDKVSSAAGLPAARLGRHFADLADGYLTALRRTCGTFFEELTSPVDSCSVEYLSVRTGLQRALRRAASDPAAARLVFRQIVEPGVAGLTCREALISELAAACSAATPPASRPSRVRAEARAAALWATLAAGGGQLGWVSQAAAPSGRGLGCRHERRLATADRP